MTYLQQINEIASKLPLPILQDINNRIRDWIVSGGEENDEYIGQQLRFAQNYLKVHGDSNE
ncbi:DUF6877 family protein [Bacillus cereus group sp. BfR-BA-01356]|uniref:DUF6877 family protein n=1 Tax=Bacillus cereus group sp. BfR-BA-01356 TaxID=2920319 RepID=UPI001F5984B3